jgi:outer membrane protein
MRIKLTSRALPVVLTTLTAASILQAAPARAADDYSPANNPNTLRAGIYFVFYHVKADDLSGPFVPAGVNLDLKNTRTAYLAYLRRLTSHLDLELAFGVPPTTKTVGRGPATLGSVPYNGQTIATSKWLAPSALLDWNFFSEGTALRPYIGVGVNYTSFYDRQVTAAGEAGTGGPTRLSLSSSVGPVGSVGLKYQPSTRWSVNLSYNITRVNTNLKTETAGEIRTTHIAFRPQALVIAAGYSF